MRILPTWCIAFLLTVLLIGTTPTGTGAGVHQFDLIHPLLGHVHLINGQIVTHEQLALGLGVLAATPQQTPGSGPALGAGAGANAADGGLGLSPALPSQAVSLPGATTDWSVSTEQRLPAGRVEQPLDPPPTSAA